MNGIINLLKPPGMSSAQAVSFVKRLVRDKVGHAGTLDPEAAGVLPLMVGRATKLFDYITEDHKVYLTEIAFGCATDTEDAQGTVTEQSSHIPEREAIKAALQGLKGTVMQRPPMYSALKRGGERLYDLARRGIEMDIGARPIELENVRYLYQVSENSHMLRVSCGKGTYIRSLCRDIGEMLGSKAHMRFLLREQVGAFSIEQAATPDEIAAFMEQDPLCPPCLLSPDLFLQHIARIDIPERYEKQVMNGVPIPADGYEVCENVPLRAYMNGLFLGIAERTQNHMKMKTFYQLNMPSA